MCPHYSEAMPSSHMAVDPAREPDSGPDPDPDPGGPARPDRQPTDMVSRLRRTLRTSLRAEYTWESLPMTHVEILHTLAEQPGIRMCDIAVELRLPPSTVSSLVRQMADDGLVERTPAAADRRMVLVSLSRKGQEQLTGWQGAHRQRIAAALAKLAEDEQFDLGQPLPALDLFADEMNVL